MTESLALAQCEWGLSPEAKGLLLVMIWGIAVAGGVGVVLGFLSAIWPRRSIQLYVWMMKKFNWQVWPIEEAREIQNTRWMGVCLLLGSGMALFLFFYRLWPWAFAGS